MVAVGRDFLTAVARKKCSFCPPPFVHKWDQKKLHLLVWTKGLFTSWTTFSGVAVLQRRGSSDNWQRHTILMEFGMSPNQGLLKSHCQETKTESQRTASWGPSIASTGHQEGSTQKPFSEHLKRVKWMAPKKWRSRIQELGEIHSAQHLPSTCEWQSWHADATYNGKEHREPLWSHRCKASEHFPPASSLSQGMSLSSQTPRLWTLKICCIGSTRNKSVSCASQKDIPTPQPLQKANIDVIDASRTQNFFWMWQSKGIQCELGDEKVKITENPKPGWILYLDLPNM